MSTLVAAPLVVGEVLRASAGRHQRMVPRDRGSLMLILGIFFAVLLGTIDNFSGALSAASFAKIVLTAGTGIVMASRSVVLDRLRPGVVVRTLVWASTANSLLGFLQWASGDGRSSGLSDHANTLGLFSVLALVGALAAPRECHRPRGIPPLWVAVVGASFGLIQAGSRSALICSAVALLLVATRRGGVNRLAVLGSVASAFMLLFLWTTPVEIELRLTDEDALDRSNETRVDLLTLSLDAAKERPLVGWGATSGLRGAHSWPLQMLVAGGVLALIPATILLFRVLNRIRRSWQSTGAEPASWTIVILVFCLFNPPMFQDYVWFCLAYGAMTASGTLHGRFSNLRSRRGRSFQPSYRVGL